MKLGQRAVPYLLVAVVGALLVGMFAVVGLAGPAQSSESERCGRFALQSRVRERMLTGTGRPVVVIGDSYSVGLGLSHPDRAWTRNLPGRVHVFGFSGSGFARHDSPCKDVAFDQRAPAALRARHSLVVLEGGLNDYNQSARSIRAGYRRLIALVGRGRVVVVGPARAPTRRYGAVRVDRILAAETARTRTPYISMIDHRFDYAVDGLHLTAHGHRQFGAVVARALR